MWGYDRNTAVGTAGRSADAPAMDTLVALSGAVSVSARIRLRLALGGGYTPVYFVAKADNKETIGLSGGFLSLSTGLEFTIAGTPK